MELATVMHNVPTIFIMLMAKQIHPMLMVGLNASAVLKWMFGKLILLATLSRHIHASYQMAMTWSVYLNALMTKCVESLIDIHLYVIGMVVILTHIVLEIKHSMDLGKNSL
jgi:hypothetical protein